MPSSIKSKTFLGAALQQLDFERGAKPCTDSSSLEGICGAAGSSTSRPLKSEQKKGRNPSALSVSGPGLGSHSQTVSPGFCLRSGSVQKIPHVELRIRSKELFKPNEKQELGNWEKLVDIGFNDDTCRKDLSNKVILDESPLRFVEVGEVSGYWKIGHPSRVTVASNVLQLFFYEKKIKK
ncbi:hypothetical protein TorRG33x02_087010 [Trema orientale]|uniref:Uncharacterized protein n=1 Tax=Trema orientale TaxID=63057 RepID=A0A2P5FCP6_TREOI|nr:hypothetical protein TorRG33x02_087010 [Trema orientale]